MLHVKYIQFSPRCRKSHVKQQIQYELTCFSLFLATRCLHVANDFRVYSQLSLPICRLSAYTLCLVCSSQQDVYMSLTILGCTVNCRFRFADCPLIHCDNQTKVLPRLCKLFHLKITCTFRTDDVRVKVSSFQKSHNFFNIKYSTETLSLFEDVPDCRDLREYASQVLLQSESSFLPRNNMKTNTISSLMIEI